MVVVVAAAVVVEADPIRRMHHQQELEAMVEVEVMEQTEMLGLQAASLLLAEAEAEVRQAEMAKIAT